MKCYIWNRAIYIYMVLKLKALQKLDQKYLESSEMLCWRRMEFISWTDRVKNEQVSYRVKQERKNLHTIKNRGMLTGLDTSCAGTAF